MMSVSEVSHIAPNQLKCISESLKLNMCESALETHFPKQCKSLLMVKTLSPWLLYIQFVCVKGHFLFRLVTQALLFVKLWINSLYWKQVRYQKIHRERNWILQGYILLYFYIDFNSIVSSSKYFLLTENILSS